MMSTSVHRLLDEAFAGVPGTPDAQDLKEEIRANLLDRVAELTASGVASDEAARRAVDELGDVRALVEEASGPTSDALERPRSGTTTAQQHRSPVSPRYVASVVVASVLVLLALTPLAAVAARRGNFEPFLASVFFAAPFFSGFVVGWIVVTSLVRETATNYGMPRRRATAYGAASVLLMIGLVAGLEGYLLTGRVHVFLWMAVPWLVVGGAWLTYLLATQTNRHKQWVLEQAREHAHAGNRFEEDPAAAARFGIYTVSVWTVAFVAFLVLGFTVGWGWSLLALVGGFVVMMLMLATMLFGTKHTQQD